MKKDARLVLGFYTLLILSVFIYWTFLENKNMPQVLYYQYHLILGGIWAVGGGGVNFLLWKYYNRSFGQLKKHEKRTIVVSALVLGLGLYLLIWSGVRLWQLT